MKIDLQILAMWAGALSAIFAFAKLVVSPFLNAIKKNNITNELLQKAVEALTRDLKDMQKDRDNVHKILEKHEERIDRNADGILVHTEQIKTLFNNEKR
ncbi:hypothetical protein [Peptoniphilus asaccharolyticus]